MNSKCDIEGVPARLRGDDGVNCRLSIRSQKEASEFEDPRPLAHPLQLRRAARVLVPGNEAPRSDGSHLDLIQFHDRGSLLKARPSEFNN